MSGSGKSTLVRMLNQLIKPTAGHIYIDGEDIATMGKRRVTESKKNENEYGISEVRSISASYGYTKCCIWFRNTRVSVEEREKKR